HNTVQIDSREQMTKGPNFLWFHWPIASAEFMSDTCLQCRASISAGTNYIHHRKIVRDGDAYTISDEFEGANRFTVRWRLAPEFDWRITSHGIVESLMQDGTQIRISCHCDQADDWQMVLSESWESLYYGERTLCPAIEVTHISGRFTTEFEPIS
ncbi:MAG: heparinase II/III family protein, partial [Planctomycetales bacterium]|nr:heparinase II/III family protein [Planctomycetales bacterium]